MTDGIPSLPPGATGLRREFNRRVETRDGTLLSADLSHPPRAAPAVVWRTPYGKGAPTGDEARTAFNAAGFAFVAVDVRGRGDSDGDFRPYVHEATDGEDLIRWTTQQPWCDGRVITWGGSYAATLQWLTATRRPPGLVAMIVRCSPSDPFVETPTGVYGGPMKLWWNRLVDGRTLQDPSAIDWPSVYRHLPLADMDTAAGFRSATWRERLAHQTLDGYWAPLCYQNRFDEIDVPVLHIGGWYDDQELGTPRNFSGMVRNAPSEQSRRRQRLLMGPWEHQVNVRRRVGEIDFGPTALIDLWRYQTAWLDDVLGGDAESQAPPVDIFVMGVNEWRCEPTWPPPYVQERSWHLDSGGRAQSRFGDGRLTPVPPSTEGGDDCPYDPQRPFPFITAPESTQIGGPDDYAGVQTRGDVLVYVSDTLFEDVELIGPVRVEAWVSTTGRDADVAALLFDVHPSGFRQRLCDGIVRLRYRDGMHQVVAVIPGEVYPVHIDLWDTCHRFLSGHRIGLQISGGAFPKFDRNLGTGADLAHGTECTAVTTTIHHGPSRPSRLVGLASRVDQPTPSRS